MPDRENVIKAWECCNPFNRKCNECPYEKDCYHDGISRHMVADAISLLKEQEPVEVIHHEAPYGYPFNTGKCPACFQQLDEGDKFCRECGQAVKWK